LQKTADALNSENRTVFVVESKYIDYRLEKLKNYNEKVKYTIDFYLEKVDKTWVLQDISEEVRQKIHGLYVY